VVVVGVGRRGLLVRTHLVDLAFVPVVGEEIKGAGSTWVCEELVKDGFKVWTTPDGISCPCGGQDAGTENCEAVREGVSGYMRLCFSREETNRCGIEWNEMAMNEMARSQN